VTNKIARVFEIDYDVNRFQVLLVDGDDEFIGNWRRGLRLESGASIRDSWTVPPLYVDRPRLPSPDISCLLSLGEVMVLSQRAFDEIGHLAAMSGELLPLPFEDKDLQALNVTEVMNYVDHQRTVWNEVGGADVVAFHPHRFQEVPIFRIPENNSARLYCWQGLGDEALEFKTAVESAGLTGLKFVEAWNTEEGGIPRKWEW
jgi:hypothetical protein